MRSIHYPTILEAIGSLCRANLGPSEVVAAVAELVDLGLGEDVTETAEALRGALGLGYATKPVDELRRGDRIILNHGAWTVLEDATANDGGGGWRVPITCPGLGDPFILTKPTGTRYPLAAS